METLLICAVLFAIGYYVTYSGFSAAAADPNHTESDMELFFTFCSPNCRADDVGRVPLASESDGY